MRRFIVKLFSQDFFRAAQTCIRFYEGVAGGPVTSYEDLYSRLHHLEEAKHHIEAVIAEKKSPKGTVNTVFAYLRQRGTASAKSAVEEPSHVTMSLSELNNHLNTINLQTEVTNFMHQSAVERGGLGILRASEGSRMPTLFGNGHVRGEMAVQVIRHLSAWKGFEWYFMLENGMYIFESADYTVVVVFFLVLLIDL